MRLPAIMPTCRVRPNDIGKVTMSDRKKEFDAEAYLDAAAPLLGLTVTAEQRPGVLLHLATTVRIASAFVDLDLPDDAEPAPVFSA